MSSEAKLSYTTKVKGTDLLTARGDTEDEFLASYEAMLRIKARIEGDTPTVAEAAATVKQVIPGSTEITPEPAAAPAPAAPDAFANATVPQCPHGVKVARSGTSAKGPWKAWMCPTPKDTPGQCKPQWVTRGTPEWNNHPA